MDGGMRFLQGFGNRLDKIVVLLVAPEGVVKVARLARSEVLGQK